MEHWTTAQHSESLEECLKTEKPITKKTYIALLGTLIYKYYCYDKRINADRYILQDMEHNLGLPTWIHHYLG